MVNNLRFFDFHTHHPSREGERVIQDGVDTWGIHPWKAALYNAENSPLTPQNLLALGECGLDRLCDAPFEQQENLFRQQIYLAEQYGKPLIIHCVRALDDLLRIRKDEKPLQPWIFHAFRGKPQQLQSLLAAGMYVSFGFLHNTESLLACPLERLLLETDDDPRPVRILYQQVAAARNIPLETLAQTLQQHASTLFGMAV